MNRKDAEHQWIFERCREVQREPDGYLDLWSREHYKDIAIDTPVLTTLGWVNHGDLVIGSKVFTPSGKTATVVGLQHFTDSECYRVTFCNGISIVAGSEHLWGVNVPSKKRINNTNKRVGREYRVHKTKELAELVNKYKYRVGISVSKPIEGEEKALPVDPYVLGAWLGDGYSAGAAICGQDHEVFDQIKARGYELRERAKDTRRSDEYKVYGIAGLSKGLRALGVLNNKHIPDIYMTASKSQRLDLLRGLVDTDGNVSSTRNSCVTFANTNKLLAEQFRTLANSLGYKARLTPARTTGSWHVCFQAYANDEMVPCFIKRKQDLLKIGINRHNASKNWYIESIERCETVPTNCIKIDSEDGLYLVGKELIPTHNTAIITFAKTIQDILASHGNDPIPEWKGREITVGLFSHSRGLAKRILRQIKLEFEQNDKLKEWFPDVLYANPHKESPKWSEDDGIVVRRKSNPAEATVEAWGVVDAQPIGKHFYLLVYDDIVVPESVTTPEMMEKTSDMLSLSYALGAEGGRRRFIGTRYHQNDAYKTVIDRGTAKPRIHLLTKEGTADGTPVLRSKGWVEEKRRDMGPYLFSAQMLQNPSADTSQGFNPEWLKYHDGLKKLDGLNIYMLVDPAGSKSKKSDYTAVWVIGLGPDENIYVIDFVRDRFNLTQRAALIINWHKKYKPVRSGGVRYEKYGLQADIEHIQSVQRQINYRFDIEEVGGSTPKIDRIKRLVPYFEQGRIYLPRTLYYTGSDGKMVDLVRSFIEEEYKAFPVPVHDDMLDALARLAEPDLPLVFPQLLEYNSSDLEPQAFDD